MVTAAVALSVLAHAGLLASPIASALARARGPEAPVPVLASGHLGERAARVALPVILAAERRELVERARADRAAGRLDLGAFLLATNALAAREQGEPFDLAGARERYAARVEKLRTALQTAPGRRAVPEVFGDLHYIGRAGGRLGDALLDGGGSCEPLAHLIAAAMFDAGHPEGAWLRYYGGDSGGGATHLAPVLLDKDREFDLLTGGRALLAGVRFEAADLVEVYARAHGLAPPIIEAAGGQPSAAADLPSTGAEPMMGPQAAPAPGTMGPQAAPNPGTMGPQAAPNPSASSLVEGYPPNHDRYTGSTPLYATRAVQEASEAAPARVDPLDLAMECAFFVRLAVLDPPTLEIEGRGAGAPVEIQRVPSQEQIDRTFAVIKATEQAFTGEKVDRADRLMGLACLTAMYDRAAVDLTFASERALASIAAGKRAEAAVEGKKLLAGIDWSSSDGAEVLARLGERFFGRSWLLLVLDGGEAPVLRMVQKSGREDWGRVNALAALVVDPKTRSEALDLLEALPQADQINVMHEVFHAHDHLRPWASNYPLDAAGTALEARPFTRAYGVFRGVAWGLWEGGRPAEEVLSQMVAEARRRVLGRDWEASLLEYYGRNAINLHATRPDAEAFSRTLRRWFEEHGYTDLEIYRVRLAGI